MEQTCQAKITSQNKISKPLVQQQYSFKGVAGVRPPGGAHTPQTPNVAEFMICNTSAKSLTALHA
jgi:hypothetical protein